MRRAEFPFLIDLFTIFLRWLVLFGLAISMGSGGELMQNGAPNLVTILVLLLPVLWNGFVSSLAIFNRRLPNHRPINVGLDMAFGVTLFLVTGGPVSAIPWVALLPIFSSAMYYEAKGAIFVAMLMSLFQGIYSYWIMGQHFQVLAIGLLGFNLVAGIVIALLSTPLLNQLRGSYQSQMNQRKESERKVQRMERDRMRMLFSMIETFSSTLNYQTVLETVLDTAISAVDENEQGNTPEKMVGAVLLFGDSQELEVRAERGFVTRDQNVRLPAEQGVLSETLKSGEAHLVEKPGMDAELSRLISLQERSGALCLPLIRGMNAFGVMLFAHEKTDFFNQERIEALQMLSNQAVIAIQNARLYQDLAHEKERIVQSQEEAQKKLARDLHDGPTQSVSAIAMRINIARKIMEKAPQHPVLKETMDELVRIEDLARRTTQEIRHMLFTLRPLVLESEGLVAALSTMADKMRDLYQQNVVIDADPEIVQQLDATRQTVIFYLSEESVNNARKHAQASEIRVRIKYASRENCIALLEIIDNGLGFDVGNVMGAYDRRGSLGMVNLRERTELINGLLKIESVPGKGTRIRVFIPLSQEAAERLHLMR